MFYLLAYLGHSICLYGHSYRVMDDTLASGFSSLSLHAVALSLGNQCHHLDLRAYQTPLLDFEDPHSERCCVTYQYLALLCNISALRQLVVKNGWQENSCQPSFILHFHCRWS